MECCLELLDAGLLVSLQDLGAAGLTSSAAEMAAAGGVGLDLDVAQVPKRNPDLEPFEVMVSESQERMLAIVEPARVDDVLAICAKWETGGTVIGIGHRGRPDPGLRRHRAGRRDPGRACWSTTARSTTSSRPIPAAGSTATSAPSTATTRPRSCWRCSPRRRSPSKRWAFEQYDPIVQSRDGARGPSRPTPPSCRSPRPAPGSPSRSTATAGASPATPTRARSRRCSSAPRTWPASGPSRSA